MAIISYQLAIQRNGGFGQVRTSALTRKQKHLVIADPLACLMETTNMHNKDVEKIEINRTEDPIAAAGLLAYGF